MLTVQNMLTGNYSFALNIFTVKELESNCTQQLHLGQKKNDCIRLLIGYLRSIDPDFQFLFAMMPKGILLENMVIAL